MLKRIHASWPDLSFRFCLVMVTLLVLMPVTALAQDNYETERARAIRLTEESKFTEALPLLEKLAAAKPSDAEVMFRLGFSRLAVSRTMTDPAARKQARANARTAFLRAKELGYDAPLLQSILEALPPDDEAELSFSKNQEADKAMHEGEAAFVQGDLNKALAAYQRALQLDPQLYEAALFAGDMYNKSGQPERSGEWFARAIAISPDRETAYRYWAIGLVQQGKMQEARDKFVEAFITEPYNRLARNGLVEWAEHNKITLAHPKVVIPTSVSSPEKGKTTITLDPAALKKDDGSSAWMFYGIKRVSWRNEKFAKTFPAEKTYRHSLAEEADALRGAIESVSIQMKAKEIKQLDPSLATIIKLEKDALLEPFILLALTDEGIAQDYAAYRKANRDKLRRYVVEYVLTGGGK